MTKVWIILKTTKGKSNVYGVYRDKDLAYTEFRKLEARMHMSFSEVEYTITEAEMTY